MNFVAVCVDADHCSQLPFAIQFPFLPARSSQPLCREPPESQNVLVVETIAWRAENSLIYSPRASPTVIQNGTCVSCTTRPVKPPGLPNQACQTGQLSVQHVPHAHHSSPVHRADLSYCHLAACRSLHMQYRTDTSASRASCCSTILHYICEGIKEPHSESKLHSSINQT